MRRFLIFSKKDVDKSTSFCVLAKEGEEKEVIEKSEEGKSKSEE